MALNARELRIGNFIFDKDKELIYPNEGIREVTALDREICHHVRKDKHGVSYSGNTYDRIDPIPLTKEILEKCGFELQPQRVSIYVNGRIKLWLGSNGVIAYLMHEDKNESFWIANPVQNLHQLQNLYFALTGTEINLTL